MTAFRHSTATILVCSWFAATACSAAVTQTGSQAAASNAPIKPPPPQATEAEETTAKARAVEAQRAEAAGNHKLATQLRNELVQKYPTTAAGADENLRRAKQAEAANQIAVAVASLESVLHNRPQIEHANIIKYHFAELLLRVQRYTDAVTVLVPLWDESDTPEQFSKVGLLLAQAYEGAAEFQKALETYVRLHSEKPNDAATTQLIVTRATDVIDRQLEFNAAVSLWNDKLRQRDWEFLQPALAFKLAKIYYHVRRYDESEKMAQVVVDKFSSSPFAPLAQTFLSQLKGRFVVETRTVGVVLPLSGRFKQYGERALEAIRLAFKSDPTIKLIVKDGGGEAPTTSRVVEELITQDHVIAIIGPLFSNEAMAAALKAEELSVPNLTLSHQEGLPAVGDYIFRSALTVEAQATALAKVAFEDLGLTRFALLHPKSRYGQDFVKAFWHEVERRKGAIRGVEEYEHDATTFAEPIRKLVGRWHLQARNDYREQVKALDEQHLPSHKRKAALEKIEKTLPPIVDFDAIVIPDTARNIGLIAPALAVEDIVITQDPKALQRIKLATGRNDIKPVYLLGGSTWNSPRTVESCERYCEDAVFVDAYFPDSPNTKVRDFVASFREAAGAEPYLSEAQAFDTAGMLLWLLNANKPATRDALQAALNSGVTYDGVTGKMRFDAEGEVQKDLFVLTIKNGTIRMRDKTGEPPRG